MKCVFGSKQKKMEPSRRQQAIYDTWRDSDVNILVNAVAGSGKTTLLTHLLEHYVDDKTLYVAFNKSIQTEMEAKIAKKNLRKGRALTMHSMGFSAVRTAYKKVEVAKGSSKRYGLVKKVQEAYKGLFSRMSREDSRKYYFALMDLSEYSRLFLTDDLWELNEYLLPMGKYFSPEDRLLTTFWDKLIEYRDDSYDGKNVYIDYTDMVFLPHFLNLDIPVDPVYLFIDEAQDLNLCQHALVERLIKQDSVKRHVCVGDPHQSIYAFSGAYSKSFDKFTSYGQTLELPLDICYRCDRKIVDLANEVYDVMEGFSQEEGEVYEMGVDQLAQIENNSLILSRNGAPLVTVFLMLLDRGRKCYIKGEGLIEGVAKFAKPYKYKSILVAQDAIQEELELLKEAKGEEHKLVFDLQDQISMFNYLANHFSPSKGARVEVFLQNMEQFFRGVEKEGIALSTVHKAKGLEADTVYIINEHTIPSPHARTTEEKIQEMNLKYVARTRAKHKYIFLNFA